VDGRCIARRGWKTSAKEPTKNVDILQALIDARDARRAAGLPDVTFEHVKGHAGHRLNGWADERAVRASQHGNRGLAAIWSTDRGPGADRRHRGRAEVGRGQAGPHALGRRASLLPRP
jgi:hypothetical protein